MEEDLKALSEELVEMFNDKGLKHLVPQADIIAAFIGQSYWLDQVTWEAGQDAWERAEIAYGKRDEEDLKEAE